MNMLRNADMSLRVYAQFLFDCYDLLMQRIVDIGCRELLGPT